MKSKMNNNNSNNNDGWLKTKVVGRDDEAIAAAREKALNARRRATQRSLQSKTKSKSKTKSTSKHKAGKRKRQNWSDDESLSLSDSDVELELELDADVSESEASFDPEAEESEEEEIMSLRGDDDDDNDIDDIDDDIDDAEEEPNIDDDIGSDSDGPSFLVKSKKKNIQVKPMRTTQATKHSIANKKKGFLVNHRDSLSKLKPVSSRSSTSMSMSTSTSSSDDCDNTNNIILSPVSRKMSTTGNSNKGQTISKYFSHTNHQKENNVNPFASDGDTPLKIKQKQKQNRNGRHAREKKRPVFLDDEDEDEEALHLEFDMSSTTNNNHNDHAKGWHDEDIVATQTAKKDNQGRRRKKLSKKMNQPQLLQEKAQTKKYMDNQDKDVASLSGTEGLVLVDSDEESEREQVQKIRKFEKNSENIYKEEEVSSSEDENGGDDDKEDEYSMDADAQEASSVLATANELSASVLRIMASWGDNDNDNDNDSTDGVKRNGTMTVPQGIIVDGAISLSKIGKENLKNKTTKNKHNQSWISAQVMQQVLPKEISLKEYQLVGVNWLAMLHSMTCKVATKKPSNVNGILADEMGLGKTCQTIAFLAWLKYSRGRGLLEEADTDKFLPTRDANESDADVDVDADADAGGDDSDRQKLNSKPKLKPKPKPKPKPIQTNDQIKSSSRHKHAKVSMRKNDEEVSPSTRLPHLVVVPASVVSNWEREFKTFAPDLHVMKYHGSQEERLELQDTLRPYLPKYRDLSIPMVDVILTSITYFQKETSDDRDFLRRFQFDYMVIDEGHLLKNAKGLRYRNLNKFKSRHRLLLTGTPVQNSPQELMALLCFLMPLFSQKQGDWGNEGQGDGGEGMLQHFVEMEGNAVANTGKNSEEAAYKKLKQLFAPFVLRRRKQEVLNQILPQKTYQVEFVELGADARRHYNDIVEEHVRAKRHKRKSLTDSLFTQLRKASHHPLLLRTRHKSPAEVDHLAHWFFQSGAFRGAASSKERVARELEKYNDFEIHLLAHELLDENPNRKDLERYILKEEDLFQSAKMVRLRELLPQIISNGHRILIFSVWTSCLDLLGVMLDNMGLRFMRMDGQTNVVERQGLIDQFNKEIDIPIFLLSTKACGMGINLTSADVCIMHDIDMNPFSDLQAEDRCHRIGQQKPVTVIKMIAKDCVDSAIYEMQDRKMKMNAAIMDNPSEWAKEEKKAKSTMIKSAIDKFLCSPSPDC